MKDTQKQLAVLDKIRHHVELAGACNMTQFGEAKKQLITAFTGLIELNKSLVNQLSELESKLEVAHGE